MVYKNWVGMFRVQFIKTENQFLENSNDMYTPLI
jgi:hypothetical protein